MLIVNRKVLSPRNYCIRANPSEPVSRGNQKASVFGEDLIKDVSIPIDFEERKVVY